MRKAQTRRSKEIRRGGQIHPGTESGPRTRRESEARLKNKEACRESEARYAEGNSIDVPNRQLLSIQNPILLKNETFEAIKNSGAAFCREPRRMNLFRFERSLPCYSAALVSAALVSAGFASGVMT